MALPEKLKPYAALVDFLADYLGEDTEVVLHDLTDWHASVAAIRNGHISGRSLGAPITDYGLELVRSDDGKTNYRANYKGTTPDGRVLRSATFFIRDGGKLIGLLCVNTDFSKLVQMRDALDAMIRLDGPEKAPAENFNIDVEALVQNNIAQILGSGQRAAALSKRSKLALVQVLEERGIFMVKGAVWYVAQQLDVSVSTVYRYLNAVKNKTDDV